MRQLYRPVRVEARSTTTTRPPSSTPTPGRDTDTQLRWVDSHRRLWTHLREAGTNVDGGHRHPHPRGPRRLRTHTRAWLSPVALSRLPDSRRALHACSHRGGIASGAHARFRPLGRLRRSAADSVAALRTAGVAVGGHSTSRPRIDSYSTHHADRLAPDALTRRSCRLSDRNRMERRHTPLRSTLRATTRSTAQEPFLVLPPVVSLRIGRRPRPNEPVGVVPGAPRDARVQTGSLVVATSPPTGAGRSRAGRPESAPPSDGDSRAALCLAA